MDEVKQPIFVVNNAGDLVRMQPSVPQTEASLQELIARYPEIIGDGEGELLLVRREQPIRDSDGSRWSLDHLFVTQGGVPVLVEVKRAADTRLRREVVGQMLDYAANGVAYWPTGTVAQLFEDTCEQQGRNSSEVIAEFLGERADVEAFWSQVDANFRGGRIKLVFVADEIPRELARIVEFLNEQMTADVRAVELRYFEGEGGFRTLAPRIIGETERAQAQKLSSRPRLEPIDREEWIERFIKPRGARVLDGLRLALQTVGALGAETGVASTQGSIYVAVPARDGKWLYPMHFQKNGTAMVSFGWVSSRVAEGIRQDFLRRFSEVVGPLSTDDTNGYPAFPMDRLTDLARTEKFRLVMKDWLDTCRDA
jgi:hypothetical protein